MGSFRNFGNNCTDFQQMKGWVMSNNFGKYYG